MSYFDCDHVGVTDGEDGVYAREVKTYRLIDPDVPASPRRIHLTRSGQHREVEFSPGSAWLMNDKGATVEHLY
jgi:hypothetical protein